MKKQTIILILALAVLLPAAALCAAEEAKAPDFWISPDGTLTPDAVSYNKTDDGYYLLLPGNMDTGKMCFGVAEGVRFTFGGREISTGDSAEGLKTGDYPVTIGKKSITLHVKAGSPGLPVLHITTESGDLRKVEFNKANKEPGRLVMKGPDGGILASNTPTCHYPTKLQEAIASLSVRSAFPGLTRSSPKALLPISGERRTTLGK